MDNLSEIIYVVGFVLFVVIGIVRYLAEGRDVARRNQEGGDWTVEELPEETKRMLFGDKAFPTIKPAQPKRNLDPFDEPRTVVRDARREFEPRMAKPRQGAPAPAPRPAQPQLQPPPVPHQPQMRPQPPSPPAHPHAQPQFRPEQQRHAPAPPRQPAAPPQPRMVPNAAEGRMPRTQQTTERQTQQQRRPQRAAQPQFAADQEGPRAQAPALQRKRTAPVRRRSRWLRSQEDIVRGIVLSEILGPPKALQ